MVNHCGGAMMGMRQQTPPIKTVLGSIISDFFFFSGGGLRRSLGGKDLPLSFGYCNNKWKMPL